MTRFVITSLILALSGLGASAAPIHVSVASPVTAARSGVATSPGGAVSFIVVLTNLSDTAVTTWENANSWGYRTLAFEITTKDGKRHIATKKRQVFTRNGPSTFVIAPGVSRLIPVRLDSGTVYPLFKSMPAKPSRSEQSTKSRHLQRQPRPGCGLVASPRAASLSRFHPARRLTSGSSGLRTATCYSVIPGAARREPGA
jgi:hypothetical protein